MAATADTAPVQRELIIPSAIVRVAGDVENTELLTKSRAGQVGLNEMNYTLMRGKCGVILDFGRELHGGVRIVCGSNKSCAHSDPFGGISRRVPFRDRRTRQHQRSCAARLSRCRFPCFRIRNFSRAGFALPHIELLEEGAELRIKAINAVFTHRARKQVGTFVCSDELINRIFDTAAYTVQLCAQDLIWDGIKRDRLVWMGDLYPEITALLCLCEDDGCIARSLDFVRSETPLPLWMNNYPMYSMWWIMNVREYCRRTGNFDYALAQRGYFYGLLEQIDGCIAEDGSFDFGGNFIDWPTHGHADEEEGVRCLAKMCAQNALELEKLYGSDGTLSEGILKKLCRRDASVLEKKQIAALKCLSGTPMSAVEIQLLLRCGSVRLLYVHELFFIESTVSAERQRICVKFFEGNITAECCGLERRRFGKILISIGKGGKYALLTVCPVRENAIYMATMGGFVTKVIDTAFAMVGLQASFHSLSRRCLASFP